MTGFVNMTLAATSAKPATTIKKIRAIASVQDAYLVTGDVDAIAIVVAEDETSFWDAVFQIRNTAGVASTLTNVAAPI